ncbi:MAG: Hsp70 family protein [Acidobacteriota bacterium]
MDWNGEIAVGITVGNAQARAAIYEDGQPRLVPLEEGEYAMPSAVLLHRLREVGKYAYLYSGTDPNLLVTSINRLLGRRYSQLQGELSNLPFEVCNERDCIRVIGQLSNVYTPIELYAMVLRKLKQATERYLGRTVNQAVLAVPGSFDDFQRRSVRVAAESVFSRVKLINEPTAALLMMVERARIPLNCHLMTFDLGAGKCEVAMVERTADCLRVKAITGDTHLGGDDIDYRIYHFLAREFQREQGESMVGDSAMARHEVLMAVRAAKHQLETEREATISVPFVNFDRFGRPLHLFTKITRRQVADLSTDLMERATQLIKQCRRDANHSNTYRLLLLGGSTRLPFIADIVSGVVRQDVWRVEDPDELAVLGASLYGAQLNGQRQGVRIEDVTAHSLGITTYTGAMGFVLRRQAAVPVLTTRRFVTVEKNQREVHIEVREGENTGATANSRIGEFWLPLPPGLPRGSPIDVTIGKDEDGIVLVRARDHVSGATREITITYDL